MALSIRDYVEKCEPRFVQELVDWLRIPSISTLPEHREDVRQAGLWAVTKLKNIGFPTVELIEGEGHPLVYAEWLGQPEQPTLLVYGHFDVQPVDPLAEWRSPPFEPVFRKNTIFARGATDDKGQLMIILAALEAWSRQQDGLPVNVKVLLEGEEEAGGLSIEQYVRKHGDKLSADAVLICDTHMNGATEPSIINGLRGIVYAEIHLKGASRDLHSGTYGGIAPNPLHGLCLLLSRLKGEDGVLHIDGVYDGVEDVSQKERSFWESYSPAMELRLKEQMEIDELVGENTLLVQERLGVRPTFEVHGIHGGFTGTGVKTVIPAVAVAKVSLRIPAGMEPDAIFAGLEKAVAAHMPDGYGYKVKLLHGGKGISVACDNPYILAASTSIEKIFGVPPLLMREGGSIPVASLFDDILGLPVVLMGFGLPGDGAHSPNEQFSLAQFKKGILTVADYLGRLRR